MLDVSVEAATRILQQGGIIAYPTEAIYGLGCSFFNSNAVAAIQALKGREENKGFIVLIADWPQLFPLIGAVSDEQLQRVRATWPGFVTWVFPKAPSLPKWLENQDSIAIRMTAHPIAKALAAQGPIISTSVNRSGHPPIMTEVELWLQFPRGIDALVQGPLGSFTQPSEIYDVCSGLRLR